MRPGPVILRKKPPAAKLRYGRHRPLSNEVVSLWIELRQPGAGQV